MGRFIVDLDNTVDYPNGDRNRIITLRVKHKDSFPSEDMDFLDQSQLKAQSIGAVLHELQAMLEDHVRIEQIEEPNGEEYITEVELTILKPIKNGRRNKKS